MKAALLCRARIHSVAHERERTFGKHHSFGVRDSMAQAGTDFGTGALGAGEFCAVGPFRCVARFCLLDASRPTPPPLRAVKTKIVPRHFQRSAGGQSCPQLRSTGPAVRKPRAQDPSLLLTGLACKSSQTSRRLSFPKYKRLEAPACRFAEP